MPPGMTKFSSAQQGHLGIIFPRFGSRTPAFLPIQSCYI